MAKLLPPISSSPHAPLPLQTPHARQASTPSAIREKPSSSPPSIPLTFSAPLASLLSDQFPKTNIVASYHPHIALRLKMAATSPPATRSSIQFQVSLPRHVSAASPCFSRQPGSRVPSHPNP